MGEIMVWVGGLSASGLECKWGGGHNEMERLQWETGKLTQGDDAHSWLNCLKWFWVLEGGGRNCLCFASTCTMEDERVQILSYSSHSRKTLKGEIKKWTKWGVVLGKDSAAGRGETAGGKQTSHCIRASHEGKGHCWPQEHCCTSAEQGKEVWLFPREHMVWKGKVLSEIVYVISRLLSQNDSKGTCITTAFQLHIPVKICLFRSTTLKINENFLLRNDLFSSMYHKACFQM